MSITPTIELLAAPRVSIARASTFIKANNHGTAQDDVIDMIVSDYFMVCQRGCIDPLIALAQMICETQNLTTEWSIPTAHPPTTIGACGETEAESSFLSWERTIRFHVGRLLAYALTDTQANGEQWHLISTSLYVQPLPEQHRGSAKTLADLVVRWSDDPDYGEKLTSIANDMLHVEIQGEDVSNIAVERGMYEHATATHLGPSASVLTDTLTGLFNRVYMEVSLDREIHQALRKGTEVGVIILNLDEFRDFNETLGYAVGDTILRELGMFLFNSVRRGDIACRYGGDAFALVLPDASLQDTLRRAEEIREAVKTLEVSHKGQTTRCNTISVGVAAFPRHGATAQTLLQAAANALYEAKKEGRDRVVVA